MSERPTSKQHFELSMEPLGRVAMVTLPFSGARVSDASTEVESQIAAWVNEGGAGGEGRR
jgi:hypothetical protein